MESENPYQPPQGDSPDTEESKKSQRPVYDTRRQSARAGMWRGAILGMKTVSLIFGLMVAGSLAAYHFGVLTRRVFPESWLIFFLQAVLLVLAGGFIYGAIPGGIILGLIEAIRFRKPK